MENLAILPISGIPPEELELYWQTLYMEDTLRFRLCDTVDPTWTDVLQMMKRCHHTMYNVVDRESKRLVGEFMFENFTGRAAQIHFSMHPNNSTRFSLNMATWATDTILNEWQHPEGGPYLHSLFGLTPVTNRAACIFVQKCGFKKIGVLPGGMHDRGNVVDGMITVKEREVP